MAAVLWVAGCDDGGARVHCVGEECGVDSGSDAAVDAGADAGADCSMCSIACGGSSGPLCYGRNGAPCPPVCVVVNWLDCEPGSRTPPRCAPTNAAM